MPATINSALMRKDAVMHARYETPASAQELAALQAAGKPLTYGELFAMRERTIPLGGVFTMTDAGAGAELPWTDRLWNWYGEKAYNIVEAAKNPGDAAIGVLKTVENLPAAVAAVRTGPMADELMNERLPRP